MSMLSALHLRNTIFDNIVSITRALCGLIMIPPWLNKYPLVGADVVSTYCTFMASSNSLGNSDFQSRCLRNSDWESGFSIRLKCKNTLKIKFKSGCVKSKSKFESTCLKSKSKSKSQKIGLESKSWTLVLHLWTSQSHWITVFVFYTFYYIESVKRLL